MSLDTSFTKYCPPRVSQPVLSQSESPCYSTPKATDISVKLDTIVKRLSDQDRKLDSIVERLDNQDKMLGEIHPQISQVR